MKRFLLILLPAGIVSLYLGTGAGCLFALAGGRELAPKSQAYGTLGLRFNL